MKEQTLLEMAREEGFSAAALIATERIVFDPAFRPYCEENLCGQYNANYSCPPTCGTPEQMKQRVLAHPWALVLQTCWPISDYSNPAPVKAAKASHNQGELRLGSRLREMGLTGFHVGASGCALCSPCAMEKGEPCAFPEQRYSCMSAYCIYVKDLAEKCGMDYTWREGKLSLYGMYVFDAPEGFSD